MDGDIAQRRIQADDVRSERQPPSGVCRRYIALWARRADNGGKHPSKLLLRRAFYELMNSKGWIDPDIVMESFQTTVHWGMPRSHEGTA